MRVRKLDASDDYSFGRGQSDFWMNVPEAPAQCARTRLMLWEGEWFLDRRAGTPYNTRVLGKRTEATRDPVLRARILGTQGIKSIDSYASQLNRDTRGFGVQAAIDTIYGQATLVEPQ